MRRLLALALLTLTLALASAPAAALAAPTKHFNVKFTFTGQTFTDGTTGTIYVGSKKTGGGSEFTNCGYEATDGTFLGNYGDPAFSSTDAVTLKNFCLLHYADRTP